VLSLGAMFAPSPLPRNLEASFRDLNSEKPASRASAIRDVVGHALRSDATRARAIPLFERALKNDADASVRAAAALALADIAAPEALPTLLVAVEDSNPHVRQMALSALGEIGDARAAQRLERALRDERPEVRYQAVIAYARVARDDAPAVARALGAALEDSDPAIRYIAMRMAEEFGTDGEPLRDDGLVARAEKLVKGDDAALPVVAALYLARLGRLDGKAVVLDVVAERRRTPEIEDEQACVELTGDLSLRDAIPDLERRAWGTRRVVRNILSWGAGDGASCAWHARIALARMGHARARAEILSDLGSWRRERREAAVVAAGRARLGEARRLLEALGDSVDASLLREALLRVAVGEP
jgi:hypothetical protein